MEYRTGASKVYGLLLSRIEAVAKAFSVILLKLVEEIPAGSERIPYLDEKNQPAPHHIYHTPEGWNLPEIKFD